MLRFEANWWLISPISCLICALSGHICRFHDVKILPLGPLCASFRLVHVVKMRSSAHICAFTCAPVRSYAPTCALRAYACMRSPALRCTCACAAHICAHMYAHLRPPIRSCICARSAAFSHHLPLFCFGLTVFSIS